MVKLKTTTTFEKLVEYSTYCIYGGLQFDEVNTEAIKKIVEQFDKNKGLIVSGFAGSGKTLIFSMLQKITHPQAKNIFSRTNVLDLVKDFNESGHDVFNKWQNRNVLFDDLGTEEMGRYYGDKVEVMEKFIQFRYDLFQQKRLITHFTTNLDSGMILQRYGHRCVSRLSEMTEIVLLGVDTKYTDRRKLKNFVGLPDVWHERIKSAEDIEWEENYKRMKIEAQNAPKSKAPGLGERMKKQFNDHEEALRILRNE